MDVFLSNGDNAALVPWLYDHSLRKRIPIEMRLEYIIYKITMNMIIFKISIYYYINSNLP